MLRCAGGGTGCTIPSFSGNGKEGRTIRNAGRIPVLFLLGFLVAGLVQTGCGEDPSTARPGQGCLKWSLSGTWTATGSCGADTGTVTQDGCGVLLAVSETGSCAGAINGDAIGAYCTDGSTRFTCDITIQDNSSLSGTCTYQGGCATTIERVD